MDKYYKTKQDHPVLWKKGEIGLEIPFEPVGRDKGHIKYDLNLYFGELFGEVFGRVQRIKRVYSFYKSEVEEIK